MNMSFKEEFTAMYKRYMKKVYFKSLFYALIYSFTVLFLLTLISWIFGFKYLWISFIIFGVVFAAVFGASILKLKPTEKEFLKKLDELGLQQRAITMYEYQNDDSLIAGLQRENAKEKINNLKPGTLSLKLPVGLYITAGVLYAFALTTSVGATLVSKGTIAPIIDDIIEKPEDVIKEYEVVYDVYGEGMIEGEFIQIVLEGQDATAVFAIPEDGWYFERWDIVAEDSDYKVTDLEKNSLTDPYREDTTIKGNLHLVAYFSELELSEEDAQNGNGEMSFQFPQDPSNSNQQQMQPGSGDGKGESAGGQYEEVNQVIDGETYYGNKTFDNAYEEAMEAIQNSDSLTEEQKKIISDYYDTIEK